MNCEDTIKFSFAYLDGEFDERERTELEAHLVMCGTCREAVELDAKFRDTVRKHLVTPAVDPELRNRVQARLSSARRQARLSQTLTVPIALAASIALAIVSYKGLVSLQQQTANESMDVAIATPSTTPSESPNDTQDKATAAVRMAAASAHHKQQPAPKVIAADNPPTARPDEQLRLVNTQQRLVVGTLTGVREAATAQDWPITEARSLSGLRTIVKMHAKPLPDEIKGRTSKIQAYLQARMRGVGAPPIVEGTGVRLKGARFSQLLGHPVVLYRYMAFGKPLTALRFVQTDESAPFDTPEPTAAAASLEGTLNDHLAGYTVLHVLRDGVRHALVSELDLEPMKALLDLP